jgi:RND family efflux transporter MFP subunit
MASGRILKINKREGDFVRRGEVIATLDPNQAGAQANATENSLSAAKKITKDTKKYYDKLVDQAEKSNDKEAIRSAKKARDLQIEISKGNVVAAEGAANVAQVGANNSVLTAPFSGTITSMPVHEGDFAVAGMPIASIDSFDSFEIETYVASDGGDKISVGNTTKIKLSNGSVVDGKIISVSPAVDTQNLKTLVRIHIEDNTGVVNLGDFVRGSIEISGNDQVQIEIPRKAIVSRGGDSVVFVVDDKNIASERVVKLGDEKNGNVSVVEGVSQGDQVVIEGQYNLVNSMSVKIYAAK